MVVEETFMCREARGSDDYISSMFQIKMSFFRLEMLMKPTQVGFCHSIVRAAVTTKF